MTDASRNHFISVSRDGRLIARRVGGTPVVVAHASEPWRIPAGRLGWIGICLAPNPRAIAREVFVVSVEYEGVRLHVEEFLARVGSTENELGQWMRAAVEHALDVG